MTKKHDVIVSHGEKDQLVQVACSGKGCPLCASTAEDRARIVFVKAQS